MTGNGALKARDPVATEDPRGAADDPGSPTPTADELRVVREQAAFDRAEAARDRARAARDRAEAAQLLARLEHELQTAHLDDLTGAYRRHIGHIALSNEIERARRGDGRMVVAFVDVDGLKATNDREGHAAGDAVLRTVVAAIRGNLRSFDTVLRYGGDEFVAGIGGMDVREVERRFELIRTSLRDRFGISISVGLANLRDGDTADNLTIRADAELYAGRRRRRQRPAE